jgi:hypothetical protein
MSNLGQDEQFFNIAVISDVIISAPNLEHLKKTLPEKIWKYYEAAIDSSDAQAWITPERWKFIINHIGKWDKAHDVVYEKMFDENAEYTAKELKILAQPLKGVHFENEGNNPIYLKYSQAVLVPGLIANTELQIMYDAMTVEKDYNDQVHEVVTRQGIKVGFNTPVTIHDKNGDLLSNFTLHKQQLLNSAWKLQQDLPTKGIKDTDVGSQIQKNIFQGLAYNLDETFYLGDEAQTGSQMIDIINEIHYNFGEKGLKAVLKALGVNDRDIIDNEDAMYASLLKQLKSRNDVPKNLTKALQAGISPFGLPGSHYSKMYLVHWSIIT